MIILADMSCFWWQYFSLGIIFLSPDVDSTETTNDDNDTAKIEKKKKKKKKEKKKKTK